MPATKMCRYNRLAKTFHNLAEDAQAESKTAPPVRAKFLEGQAAAYKNCQAILKASLDIQPTNGGKSPDGKTEDYF